MGFFKAYDMRGTFGVDFTCDTVRRVGRALPRVVPGQRWLVGRDARVSGRQIENALIEGLLASGVDVVSVGYATTPMVYFTTADGNYDGSVMITASHNPCEDNGLKVSRRGALPVGYADGLDRVERIVAENEPLPPFDHEVEVPFAQGAHERYQAWLLEHAPFEPNGLNYLVDCSNGVAALYADRLLPGADIVNDEIDGFFPDHSPNPLEESARCRISVMTACRYDCGVLFDGDADRCVFVDETGAFVQPDYLIPIVAQEMLGGRGAGAKVIHDVRTSRGVIETLREMGCEPVMVPVGHAFAKPALRTCGAICGGELAGHYYFSDFFGCDSGMLAARRILAQASAAKSRGQTFSQMMAPIVTRYANSGELNFRVPDKDAAIARLLAASAASLPPERSRVTIDGLRVEFDEGWFNVRPSNTEPYLRLIVETDTRERLADWLDVLTTAVEGTKKRSRC